MVEESCLTTLGLILVLDTHQLGRPSLSESVPSFVKQILRYESVTRTGHREGVMTMHGKHLCCPVFSARQSVMTTAMRGV